MTCFPTLAAGQVHVCALRSDDFAAASNLPELTAMLSEDELQRAGRFHTHLLSQRYVVSHAMLRKVLGAYLQVSPCEIKIMTESTGRPYLAAYSDIDFNLSHTDGMTVVAISAEVVGTDVERLRDNIDANAVGQRVFSARENATIRADLAASETPFFDYWTIKEAYAKAVGMGVRINFRAIDVALDEPMSVALPDCDADDKAWLFALYGCREYRLAVAAKWQTLQHKEIVLIELNNELEPEGPLAMHLLHTNRTAAASQPNGGSRFQ